MESNFMSKRTKSSDLTYAQKQKLLKLNERTTHYTNIMEKIVSHYDCPENCDAECCKINLIDFCENEYSSLINTVDKETKDLINSTTRLYKLDKDLTIIKEVTGDRPYRITKIKPCPLLTVDCKCRIYENRPTTCKPYPFNFDNFAIKNFVTITPCALGINIIADIVFLKAEFLMIFVQRRMLTLNDAKCNMKNLLQNFDDLLHNGATKRITLALADASFELPLVLSVLNSMPKEDLTLRREKLFEFVKNNIYNLSIDIAYDFFFSMIIPVDERKL
jgi:Fe-S-cluster containining protein